MKVELPRISVSTFQIQRADKRFPMQRRSYEAKEGKDWNNFVEKLQTCLLSHT